MNTPRDLDSNWFSSALLSSIDGFFDWSIISGKITLSASLKSLLGYARQDLNGDNRNFFLENLHTADQERVLKEFAIFFASSRMEFSSEFRLKLRDGNFKWLRLQGRCYRDDLGKCHRFAGVLFNINEYKRHLSESMEGSDAKSKFIAVLNHELRSPLASIVGTTRLMMEEPLSEKQTRYANNIIQSADLLLTLVNDILDISKITAGKLEIDLQPFDFSEVLENTVEMYSPTSMEKGLFIKTKLDPAIPKTIIGDSVRIRQIILNLCSNALKFTKDGGIHINTRYTPLTANRGKLRIEIVDTGIGIPEDKISLLFQDFTQADISTSRRYGGTGLGLSICKKLVDLMGGEIKVTSKNGEGSTFAFEIPVGLPTKDATTTISTSPKELNEGKASYCATSTPSENSKRKTALNILVAEDNAMNQEIMKGLLENLGHQVTLAENGEIAANLCLKGKFDIILMDINMPVMDGVESCQKIRKTNKTIPIIAVTANSLDSERKRCIEAGMNDFTTKPVDKKKLTTLLEPYLPQATQSNSSKGKESPMTSSSVPPTSYIEIDAFKQLIEDLGESKIKNFVDLYKKDAPKLIENLKGSINPEQAAHTLAGMSENLNFSALGKQSRIILQLAKEHGSDDKIKELSAILPSLYDATLKSVENLLP